MLYKDFNDYWRYGKHGCSSCSRDIAEEIWADLEPTILATRGDWENILIEDCKRQREDYIRSLREMHAYLKEFDLEKFAGVKYFKWLLDRRLGEEDLEEGKKE